MQPKVRHSPLYVHKAMGLNACEGRPARAAKLRAQELKGKLSNMKDINVPTHSVTVWQVDMSASQVQELKSGKRRASNAGDAGPKRKVSKTHDG